MTTERILETSNYSHWIVVKQNRPDSWLVEIWWNRRIIHSARNSDKDIAIREVISKTQSGSFRLAPHQIPESWNQYL